MGDGPLGGVIKPDRNDRLAECAGNHFAMGRKRVDLGGDQAFTIVVEIKYARQEKRQRYQIDCQKLARQGWGWATVGGIVFITD